jgi:Ca2+-binding RTX toxin-like protein
MFSLPSTLLAPTFPFPVTAGPLQPVYRPLWPEIQNFKVNGTSGPDVINVTQDANLIHVTLNGVETTGATWFYNKITINGNDGNDVVTIDPSVTKRVVFNGGNGDDQLNLNPAAGTAGVDYSGGDGTDIIDYSASSVDLNISLDGVANDGRAGENSNIMPDVERVRGGSGNDYLTGADGHNDSLHGNGGNDVIRGGNGDDELYGDDGNDLLIGGLGADTFHGGAGEDTVDYSDRTQSVYIYLNGMPNSGFAGEGDKIHTDVEDAIGGSGDDTMVGGPGFTPHVFYGGAGNDQMDGGAGDCTYYGQAGNDTITLGAGHNTVFCQDGNMAEVDTIIRGGGVDTIHRDSWDIVR